MTIVVGHVPTKEGRASLGLAIEEARIRGTRLVVVAVGHTGEPQGPQVANTYRLRADETREKLAEGLGETERLLADAGVDHEIRTVVSSENAAAEVLRAAEELEATAIVIGLRRRSPIGKLVFGSNAQQILLSAPCPVIAVHDGDRPIPGPAS